MAKRINLVNEMLKRGRHLHDLGLSQEASRVFSRLNHLSDLPLEIAEEVQGRLAEIRFEQGRYRRARRHLAAALAYQPHNPHYHYMMGLAAEADQACDPKRAAAHFRRSLKIDPDHPIYWCSYGLQALMLGRRRAGLTALRRARRLAPDDPDVLAQVVQGLTEEGLWEEARELVRAARFRQPKDQAVRQLWERLQFDRLHAQQQQTPPPADDMPSLPIILPFPVPRTSRLGGKTLRQDRPSGAPSPHARRSAPKKH